jgi:hypothetical protein
MLMGNLHCILNLGHEVVPDDSLRGHNVTETNELNIFSHVSKLNNDMDRGFAETLVVWAQQAGGKGNIDMCSRGSLYLHVGPPSVEARHAPTSNDIHIEGSNLWSDLLEKIPIIITKAVAINSKLCISVHSLDKN